MYSLNLKGFFFTKVIGE